MLSASLVLLPGCTTVMSGFISAPPGVNKYSFRECLAANGFLTDRVLIGDASDQYKWRHRSDRSKPHPDIETMSDAKFARHVADILHDGLFPHHQFAGLRYDTTDSKPDTSGYDEGVSDPVYNRPYINTLEGGPYNRGGSIYDIPNSGDTARLDIPMNRFLDCYLAPVGRDEKVSQTGDFDLEGRLLRAHILLAMLSSFGGELVKNHAGKRQATEATQMLAHIKAAELALRSASPIMNADLRTRLTETKTRTREAAATVVLEAAAPAPAKSAGAEKATKVSPKAGDALPAKAGRTKAASVENPATSNPAAADPTADKVQTLTVLADRPGWLPVLRWQGYVTRILRVFQVGVDIEVVDARQSLDGLTDIIAAFRTPTPGAFKGVVTNAVKGLISAQKVQLVGSAMRLDGVETLASHRLALKSVPEDGTAATLAKWTYDVPSAAYRWAEWDVVLQRACSSLAGLGNVEDPSCLPKPEQLAAALKAELPAVETSAPPAAKPAK